LANALLRAGLAKGDVVMMQLLNCPEFAFGYIAAHKTGAVCCPVSFRFSPGELAFSIDDSKPKVLMFNSCFGDIVAKALEMSEFQPGTLIVVEEGTDCRAVSYREFVMDASQDDPDVSHNIYDETARLYTSGTTGHAKAVPLTSINEVLSAHDVMIHFPMSYRDVTINTTPWFHRGGLHCAGPCPAFYAGAAIVVMPKFDAKTTLEYVSEYGITFIVGVPTVLGSLADEQEETGHDLSSLKGIVTMGSPLEKAACIRYQKVLTPNIFNGYGTTETFWNTFLRPFDLPENAGTAGASCIDDDVRVVRLHEGRRTEPDDLAAQDGQEIGEVLLSSPAKSPYLYFNNDPETERKYYAGFLYTNDLATWDDKGFITIVGRRDDMIISSGENIYPTEIEEVLAMNPKVKDSIVTSVPDKVRGQLVTAYVIPADKSLSAAELDTYCKESPYLANFKRPRYYRFVESLPYTATGKKRHVQAKENALTDLAGGLLERI
ncbi:MAG: AMP-binding protein, partial [Bacteroidales bacterium]|nr:AMP-binding protein [Bacteroidales bacterium]